MFFSSESEYREATQRARADALLAAIHEAAGRGTDTIIQRAEEFEKHLTRDFVNPAGRDAPMKYTKIGYEGYVER